MKKQITTKLKDRELLPSDIQRLDLLIYYDFERTRVYDELFKEKNPEKLMNSNHTKQRYFDYLLTKEQAHEYIKKKINENYNKLYLSRENIIMKILGDIQGARRENNYPSVMAGYNLISKLSGFLIDRHQIQISAPMEINYILPEEKNNDVTIDYVQPND